MNNRWRRWLPLGAGLVLVLALLLSWGLGSSPASPSGSGTLAPSARSGEGPPPTPEAATPVTPRAAAPEPPRAASATAAVEPSTAPAESLPSLEVANPLPQQNDPIEPELPQTAEWKHGKLVRITEVLTRDVARLEGELQAARGRGDAGEARRLEVQIARHRARLGSLHEETEALAKAAQEERLP